MIALLLALSISRSVQSPLLGPCNWAVLATCVEPVCDCDVGVYVMGISPLACGIQIGDPLTGGAKTIPIATGTEQMFVSLYRYPADDSNELAALQVRQCFQCGGIAPFASWCGPWVMEPQVECVAGAEGGCDSRVYRTGVQ